MIISSHLLAHCLLVQLQCQQGCKIIGKEFVRQVFLHSHIKNILSQGGGDSLNVAMAADAHRHLLKEIVSQLGLQRLHILLCQVCVTVEIVMLSV